MYAEFFGLKQDPFSIAPDPRYLFMSERHREALAQLLYGIRGGGGGGIAAGKGRLTFVTERRALYTTSSGGALVRMLPDLARVAAVLVVASLGAPILFWGLGLLVRGIAAETGLEVGEALALILFAAFIVGSGVLNRLAKRRKRHMGRPSRRLVACEDGDVSGMRGEFKEEGLPEKEQLVMSWLCTGRVALLASIMALATACTSTTPVKLRYPDGRLVQCGPYPSSGMAATAGALREEKCINDHLTQGALRI